MSYFKPRNLLLVFALSLALILVVVIALRYRPEDQLQSVIKALPEGIDVSLEDIDYTHIEGGTARWRLVAHEVKRDAESKVMAVVQPRLEFYSEQGAVDGELQAVSGEVSDDYQKVYLRGDVVLKNSAGYTLYTESLDYDHAKEKATTDAHVRLLADGMTMEGTGMVFVVPRQHVELKSDVHGVFDAD